MEDTGYDLFSDQIKEIQWADTFLDMSVIMSKHSHCVSKKVACIITKEKRIISTGINGTPAGMTNCDSIFDEDSFNTDEHHDFSLNYECHAEMNALLTAARNGVSIKDCSLYTNLVPCRDCAKAIIASGIRKVFFKNFYERDLMGFTFLVRCDNIKVVQVIDDFKQSALTISLLNKINSEILPNTPFIERMFKKDEDEI
jgi:dCMP deaminase